MQYSYAWRAARPLLALLLGLVSLLSPGHAAAQGLPDFDVQAGARGTTLPPDASDTGRLASRLPGTAVQVDSLTGTASRVSRQAGALTPPSSLAPATIGRRFLADHPELFRLKDAEVSALYTSRQYASPGLDVTHTWLSQQVAGIPVFKATVKLDVNSRGELLAVSGSLVPQVGRTLTAAAPGLAADEALALAARYSGLSSTGLPAPLGPSAGRRLSTRFGTGRLFEREPVVELVYFPTGKGRTSLAWETTLWQRQSSDVYHVLVDTGTGQLLYRKNYTRYAQGTVFGKEAPVNQIPAQGSGGALARVVKPFSGADTFLGTALFPSGNPHLNWWAGAPATSTRSNNVWAGGARSFTYANEPAPPALSAANGDFTFAVNLAQDPGTYTNAAIANLFYWNNRCHDVWYKFGFDEAAANFQTGNFGLGGVGNDAVYANAQFGADINSTTYRNNANFSTPPDGEPGRMRMFVFDLTSPYRDGDFTADVIVHEFGHGLTNRIIGNGDGLSGFQGGSMGEGWSDFQALMLLTETTDALNGSYPVGGYLVDDLQAGIRQEPYSTNVNGAVFTRTYGDIGDSGGEVHLAGEIMCNALWQVHGKLAARLGAVAGRQRAMQLFIDACKLCPDEPTFLDFRDKLVAADQTRFAGADKNDIWAAFASRGMGFSATTTGPSDKAPVEAFDLPPAGSLSISGTITVNGGGLAGATVTAGSRTGTSAANGSYSVTFLAAGTYTVTPSLAGYSFTPASRSVTLSTASATGVSFTATALPAPAPKADYRFQNNLASSIGTAPALRHFVKAGNPTNTFAQETVAGQTRAVLRFPEGNGLDLTPTTGVVSAGTYSMVLLFRLSTVSGYNRLIDVKNPAEDRGYYVHEGKVQLYAVGEGTGLVGANQYVQVVFTRDGTTGTVTGYLNGAQQFSNVDNSGQGLLNSTLLKFFHDGFGYDTPGAVARIRLYNVVLTPAQVAGLDRVPPAGTLSITGTVTLNGAGLSGVTVSAGAKTATTAANGTYSITGLGPGSYTLVPSRTSTTFTPTNRTVSLTTASVAGQNFAAAVTQTVHNISGTVTLNGAGLAGVTVAAGGKTATTAANGNYTLSGLASGSYTVTPSKTGFTFTPVNRSVTVGSVNVTGVNFTATGRFGISGTVTLNGAGLSGVTLSAGGRTATTAASGAYSLTGLGPGSYTVTPGKRGYTFTPANRAVSITTASVTGVNFTAAAGTGITPKADYRFQNSLASSVAGAPALQHFVKAGNAVNSFATETVGGASRTVLRFPQGNGLDLTPTTNIVGSGNYSMVLLFRLSNVSGYQRTVDVKNPSENNGYYLFNGRVQLYAVSEGSTAAAAEQWIQVVLTRNATTKTVSAYFNGTQEFSSADNNNYGLLNTSLLKFFHDAFGYNSAGAVARIRLYDTVLTPAQVSALDR